MTYSNSWANSTPAHPQDTTVAPTAHDVLILCVVTDSLNAVVFTWPAGFDEIANVLCGTTDGSTLGVARKKDATGSETSLSVSNDLGAGMISACFSYSGRDNVNPESVTSVNAHTNSNDASPWAQAATIVPGHASCDVLAIMDSDVTNAVDVVHTFADTIPLSWNVRQDTNSGFYNMALADAAQASAASVTVTGTGTSALQNASRALVAIALRPSGPSVNVQQRIASLFIPLMAA